jgi:hypothetical protein
MRNEYIYQVPFDELKAAVELDFPGFGIAEDKNIRFFNYHTPNITSGRKQVTIRFAKPTENKLIRLPTAQTLPWLETSPENPYAGPQIGEIYIPRIAVATVRDFPAAWAKLDLYPTKKAMLEDIGNTYHHVLQPDDVLSMYWIDPC